MDVDDDLTPWAVPLDEPAEAPTPPPAVATAPVAEPPRLSLLSRDVPNRDFQPRLWADR
jgi:hypothetical protein